MIFRIRKEEFVLTLDVSTQEICELLFAVGDVIKNMENPSIPHTKRHREGRKFLDCLCNKCSDEFKHGEK